MISATVQRIANGGYHTKPRVSKTPRENHDLEQPAPGPAPVQAPDGNLLHPLTETPKPTPRPNYPVPVADSGRAGASAGGRGGEGGLNAERDLPHFYRVWEEKGAARRPKRESRVDYPVTAAKRAAAEHELPTARQAAANKQRRSDQVEICVLATILAAFWGLWGRRVIEEGKNEIRGLISGGCTTVNTGSTSKK